MGLYAKREPLKGLAVMILMFSLAGIPPMVGFFGKFAVLLAAVDAGLVWLAVAGVIASVIGAFYYLRIVYYMYFGSEDGGLETPMAPLQWGLLVASAAIMVFGIANLFGIEGVALAAAETLVR
jgi:NADH-quinone oxidoreductase subunit N